jgi:hypothetical protein
VNLENLYALRNKLPKMDVFIVNTGRKVEPFDEYNKTTAI